MADSAPAPKTTTSFRHWAWNVQKGLAEAVRVKLRIARQDLDKEFEVTLLDGTLDEILGKKPVSVPATPKPAAAPVTEDKN